MVYINFYLESGVLRTQLPDPPQAEPSGNSSNPLASASKTPPAGGVFMFDKIRYNKKRYSHVLLSLKMV